MKTQLKFDKNFFRDLWKITKPYWTSEEKWSAIGLLSLNVICIIAQVRIHVGYNYFHKIFFNALQNFDKPGLIAALEYLLVLLVLLAGIMSLSIYCNNLLSLRWRRWLTKNYLDKWLTGHNHYHLQILKPHIDNPDQRMSEDLDEFPTKTLSLFGTFLSSVLMLISFGYILWGLSKDFKLIPGYLVWVAFVYAFIGSWILAYLGKKLASLDYLRQKFNANFRFGLVRMREASEQVSLFRGEQAEQKKFQGLFDIIFGNVINIISLKLKLNLFNKAYNFAAYAVGLVVSIPYYLAKTITLGVVMQISSAFNSVVSAFSVFMEAFYELAEWRSIIHRLAEFTENLDELNHKHSNIKITYHDHPNIIVDNLQLKQPDGNLLLQKINLNLEPGQFALLQGPSGSGKSTFMRALAGIWSFGEGNIHLPKFAKSLFLPQKPYFPQGTLKEVLLYPEITSIDESKLTEILSLCSLDKFKHQLNDTRNWSHELSLGEQQLIAFARIFLHKPDLLFLDEATSAIDENTEHHIYTELKKFLRETTIISISHRHHSIAILDQLWEQGLLAYRHALIKI